MNYQEAYESVKLLNSIFGRLEGVTTVEQRKAQLDLVREELEESIKGLGNPLEELDGACDMFVTVAGYMQQLERNGYDVQRALQLVCENNLTKVIKEGDEEEVLKTYKKYEKDRGKFKIVTSILPQYLIVKNTQTGKVLKPASFVSVDISDCLPKGV